jgi:NADPH-dependent 2,4-dienoyl-CoA reductase/sulfur reductase-like enzyme
MPQHYKYLIVGGGMTGDAAIDGIREIDPAGSIGLFSTEQDYPYNRPPLSKGVWKGEPVDTIWRGQDKPGVNYHLGLAVKAINLPDKQINVSDGKAYSFDKLLLATGASPRHFDFGGDEEVIYYRTVADYRRLKASAQPGQHFAVVGGGFIGAEIAAALTMNGVKVTMLFPSQAIGNRVFPADLSRYLNDYYTGKGVEVRAGETISGLAKIDGKFFLKTGQKQPLEVDGVVAGLGIRPNTGLAEAAGLKLDDGILVDERLRTSHPDVYAAGDVARFYNPALGKLLRVEHEDNANTMGRLAGRNMAGQTELYTHLPSFYSDLFELGYEAVGDLDSRLEIVADWQEPFQQGQVYYLQAGRVRGVLLWNTWDKVDAARALIAEPGPFEAAALTGRLAPE